MRATQNMLGGAAISRASKIFCKLPPYPAADYSHPKLSLYPKHPLWVKANIAHRPGPSRSVSVLNAALDEVLRSAEADDARAANVQRVGRKRATRRAPAGGRATRGDSSAQPRRCP